MLPRLSNLTYEKRWKLKYRAWNIVECVVTWSWFIKYWMDTNLRWNIYLKLMIITRGHNFKLKKPLFKTTIRQHIFNNRVVINWSSLPFDVVNATFINSFKNKLDKCWKNRIMSREKYKQTICFSPVVFISFYSRKFLLGCLAGW